MDANDRYTHWFPRLLAKINRSPNWAITLGQATFYSESRTYVDNAPSWRRHEDCHKRQWAKVGNLKFAATYTWYCVRYGYLNNPYEVEARAAERL